MKRITILGSTGSIGQNTLRVIATLPKEFKVVGLSAYSNTAILLKQVKQFNPKYICLVDELAAGKARLKLPSSCKLLSGQEGLMDLIHKSNADTVVLAIEGADALTPLIESIKAKKTIILANKEALVIAGSIIMDMECSINYT